MKRTSKYLNKQFGNWTCTAIYLAANYCGNTKHNYYRYQLSRQTSDNKCVKYVTVSASTMTKIDRGLCSVEDVVKTKLKTTGSLNHILYRFN